jgi:hypothetical protein
MNFNKLRMLATSNASGAQVLRIRTPHANDVLCGRGGGKSAGTVESFILELSL